MIIEFSGHDEGKVCIVHIDPLRDSLSVAQDMIRRLEAVQQFPVVAIQNGKPCPTNPLPKINIYNLDDADLADIVARISETKHGDYLGLSAEDMKTLANAQKSGDLVTL